MMKGPDMIRATDIGRNPFMMRSPEMMRGLDM
jgi:hypothetical protein